jgi:hypothetical protein
LKSTKEVINNYGGFNMKLFPILNKPSLKAGNKQTGLVFLEYVIMAFIATVAVICAIWWLYWHLQQMTWEIKDRLKELPRTCKLEKPGGPESIQPEPWAWAPIIIDESGETSQDKILNYNLNYPHQYVEIKNTSPDAPWPTNRMTLGIFFGAIQHPNYYLTIGPGYVIHADFDQSSLPGPDYPVRIEISPHNSGDTVSYDINITPYSSP